MKLKASLCALILLCMFLGFTLQSNPYHTASIGSLADQYALDHRDSPYSHISWVASDSGNFSQLRFFNKVEGGVCLHPAWDEYSALNDNSNSLGHLIPKKPWPAQDKPGPTWPSERAHPNPGTLPHTKYVCLFPTGILLNKSVMQAAGGDYRKAAPNIIIVGLGSAIGISVLAHHFPEASITVVDIDQVVIDMVMGHYPLINWLCTQKCSDGRPRLKIVACDARQYLHYPKIRNDNGMKYDLVVLDAYTSGSTIPSHLMTQEFFEEIYKTMTDDGILMSNIIGSYTGRKQHVVGGAMRSMHAAGLTHIHNFPITNHPGQSEEFQEIFIDRARNNIILASPAPLDPQSRKKAWAGLRAFTMYPELQTNTYVSELIKRFQNNLYSSSEVPVSSFSKTVLDEMRSEARKIQESKLKGHKTFTKNDDITKGYTMKRSLVEACIAEVKKQSFDSVMGWDDPVGDESGISYIRTDHLLFVRRCFERSIAAARKKDGHLFIHSLESVVGTDEADTRKQSLNPDAPLFTDAQPNADIYNR